MKPTLRYAARGTAVVEAQTKLNLLMPDAEPPLAADGIYGNRSVKRVQQFQTSKGLTADGVVGPKTWAALDGKAAPKPTGQAPKPSSNPQYKGKRVRQGARIYCSFGTGSSALLFFDASRDVATVNDFLPYGNVVGFKKCCSPMNPQVIMKSEAKGELSPVHCQPIIPHPWTPGFPIEKVGTPPAPALDQNSTLQCVWGGIITIKH